MNPIEILDELGKLRGATALDVGARDCAVSKALAKRGFSVVAIDPEDRATDCEDLHITFQQTSFETFESDEQFDTVIARLVLHLIKTDIPITIERLLSFTKEGGILYFTTFGEKDTWFKPGSEKTEIDTLLHTLNARILYFEEIEEKKPTYAGEMKDWHTLVYVVEK